MVSLTIPRWNDVLINIYNSNKNYRYCQKLKRESKCSLSHLREIIKKLEQNRLIKIHPTRKIKNISLTEKGIRVTNSILAIKSELTTQ